MVMPAAIKIAAAKAKDRNRAILASLKRALGRGYASAQPHKWSAKQPAPGLRGHACVKDCISKLE